MPAALLHLVASDLLQKHAGAVGRWFHLWPLKTSELLTLLPSFEVGLMNFMMKYQLALKAARGELSQQQAQDSVNTPFSRIAEIHNDPTDTNMEQADIRM